jgi:hypothetical protein
VLEPQFADYEIIETAGFDAAWTVLLGVIHAGSAIVGLRVLG